MENVIFRTATIDDLPDIIRMLADDFLGAHREQHVDPLPESYVRAFKDIDADANNHLIVAELGGEVVGTLQLTITPSISFQGGKRASVESVRVEKKLRGAGIGRKMMLWAIELARNKGCISMQLTTNTERQDAHRFYSELGFKASHVGMKLSLESGDAKKR
ncbi:MAG: GNAT family N-acetyltransferase [Pyrinomonadaceae bacterium]